MFLISRKIKQEIYGSAQGAVESAAMTENDLRKNFTTAQGLVSNGVGSIFTEVNGDIYHLVQGGGVSRYDGKTLTNFTTTQGLVSNGVRRT